MKVTLHLALGVLASLGLTTAQASTIYDGTLYYTNFQGGGDNVNKFSFSYDQGTQSLTLGPVTGISTTPGADGIIFAPDGSLLVGGQVTGKVYDVNATTGTFTSVS